MKSYNFVLLHETPKSKHGFVYLFLTVEKQCKTTIERYI